MGLAWEQEERDGNKEGRSFRKMKEHEERHVGREGYLGPVRLWVAGWCGEVALNDTVGPHYAEPCKPG